MRPVVILLSSALAVVAAAPARGVTEPRITGSYSVSGQSHSAAWSLGARLGGDSDGSVPAVLSAAGGTDIVRPCDGLTGMGTITTHIAGVADAGARMRLAIRFDLRRGTGDVEMYAVRQSSGQVLSQEIVQCTPPADAGNGTVDQPYDATLMFDPYFLPRPWAVRRQPDGSWTGVSSQLRGASLTHRASVRLVGGAASMNAACRVPSAYQLRFMKTVTKATAFIARDGFTRPRTAVRPSLSVMRGRFFIAERVMNMYMPCGARMVTLVRSSGRP